MASLLVLGAVGVSVLAWAGHQRRLTEERRQRARERLNAYRVFVVAGAAGGLGHHLTRMLLGTAARVTRPVRTDASADRSSRGARSAAGRARTTMQRRARPWSPWTSTRWACERMPSRSGKGTVTASRYTLRAGIMLT